MSQHQVQVHQIIGHHIVAIHDSIRDHHSILIHHLVVDEVEDDEVEVVGKSIFKC
jgi:hypothetical protein